MDNNPSAVLTPGSPARCGETNDFGGFVSSPGTLWGIFLILWERQGVHDPTCPGEELDC